MVLERVGKRIFLVIDIFDLRIERKSRDRVCWVRRIFFLKIRV